MEYKVENIEIVKVEGLAPLPFYYLPQSLRIVFFPATPSGVNPLAFWN